MPLELGDLRNLQEQPLSRSILEAWLNDAQLHSTWEINETWNLINDMTYRLDEQKPWTNGWPFEHEPPSILVQRSR